MKEDSSSRLDSLILDLERVGAVKERKKLNMIAKL